jgi:4,5-dihydroxyphthalate decarboxylase
MPGLRTAIADHALVRPLWQSDRASRLGLERIPIERAVTAMRQMVRTLAYDVCEMAFVTYLCAKAAHVPVTALPVFVTRGFHHRAIVIRDGAGIDTPKDLEGRAVLANRGYTVTTNVWARGILASECGVDLARITWLPTDEEHVVPYRAPANVDYRHKGEDALQLLQSGRYDAAVGDIRSDLPGLKPLIADPSRAGLDWFRRTGVYPANHTIVVKDAVLRDRPGFARALYEALVEAKATYLSGLKGKAEPAPGDAQVLELMGTVGDPFPFGLAQNRKAIETLVRFAVAQQVIPKAFDLSELFAADTLALV